MLFSAIPEIINATEAKTFMSQLGYPEYFNPFIGVLKVLGAIAILVPGFPVLKEWAYAGFFFDLFGATYSQWAAFGPIPQLTFMLLPFVLWLVSYIYFRKRLKATGGYDTAVE
jgi:hypothetical protein